MNTFPSVLNNLKIASRLFFFLTLLTGVIYPLVVTGFAQIFFSYEANGSLIKKGEVIVGSELIGQYFNSTTYFWGRPSATKPYPYNGAHSSGSNMAPSNPAFIHQLQDRVAAWLKFNNTPVPIDLVTSSGSGLDPEISPWAAEYQVSRIATARHLPGAYLMQLIQTHTHYRTFGILGEPRINVLELNLALDELGRHHG